MRQKEHKIFVMIFRIKNQLELLEELLLEYELSTETQEEVNNAYQAGKASANTDKVFPVKKKRGRPPGKKK